MNDKIYLQDITNKIFSHTSVIDNTFINKMLFIYSIVEFGLYYKFIIFIQIYKEITPYTLPYKITSKILKLSIQISEEIKNG